MGRGQRPESQIILIENKKTRNMSKKKHRLIKESNKLTGILVKIGANGPEGLTPINFKTM